MDELTTFLPQILEGILLWAEDSKNKFRAKVGHRWRVCGGGCEWSVCGALGRGEVGGVSAEHVSLGQNFASTSEGRERRRRGGAQAAAAAVAAP